MGRYLLRLGYLLIIFSTAVFAQERGWDDPTRDQVPPSVLRNVKHLPPTEAVVTIDNWDNFNMGTDFAEGHVVANPANPVQFANAWNTNATHYTMNGFDWLTKAPAFGTSMLGDMAYDSVGTLYYQNMYGSSSVLGCKILKSTDNGTTWGSAVTGIAGSDKNWIAADQSSGPYKNHVYCVMTGSGSGNYYRSTNNGTTYTSVRTFSPHGLPGMMVAVGPNTAGGTDVPGGCVYIVTNSGQAYASVYTFFTSTDGGATFTQKSSQSFSNYVGTYVGGRNAVLNMRTRPYPFITADNSYGPNRGRLYLVYASNNPAGDARKPDIFCRYSTDQGATWSAAKVINDDPNSQNNHQWMPAIWCDKPTGRLYVQWMDTRDVPTSDSCYIYASYSDDGGLTFAPNQRISNKKFKINCSTCGGGGTPAYQGDYNGIASNGGVSLAVWGDFRNGQFGSFSAYFPDYKMVINTPTVSMGVNDTASVSSGVVDTKLYTGSVKFSAAITPVPPVGSFTLSWPNGDSLATVPSAMPIIVKIQTQNVPLGTYTLTITSNGPNGTPVHKRTSSVVVTGPNIYSTINLTEGWNMVSIPRLTTNMSVNAIFPARTSAAYSFANGYVVADTLVQTKGYWVRFAASSAVTIEGPVSTVRTIAVNEGWNMIGGYERSASVAGITSVPTGIINSVYYGYNNGYTVADSLRAGKGYWVRATQNGTLTLNYPSIEKTAPQKSTNEFANASQISITGSTGKSSTLYLVNSGTDLSRYEMPPVPPAGVFDVRFNNNSFVQTNDNSEKIIQLSSAEYPVTIKVQGINVHLRDLVNGQIVNRPLQSGEEFIITDASVTTLAVQNNVSTMGYELEQNYPNPFNPATTISYTVPANGIVTLKIFDILGRETATLVNQMQTAGKYSVDFYGAHLASGTYFYELKAGDFRSIKKMQIVK
ncbi:MAG: exo-alpha-sialidase [Ignavibacteriales bacterium]|nr:exo-alpha-sialidase [Ignavibacteriales bacterium]